MITDNNTVSKVSPFASNTESGFLSKLLGGAVRRKSVEEVNTIEEAMDGLGTKVVGFQWHRIFAKCGIPANATIAMNALQALVVKTMRIQHVDKTNVGNFAARWDELFVNQLGINLKFTLPQAPLAGENGIVPPHDMLVVEVPGVPHPIRFKSDSTPEIDMATTLFDVSGTMILLAVSKGTGVESANNSQELKDWTAAVEAKIAALSV